MASTTILSDNGVSSGSAGLKSSGGNDGVLILQTTTSGGTATNAVYVDTSQNVGLGVVPSAWGSGKAIELTGGALFSASSTDFYQFQNSYFNGTNFIYKTTNAAGYYVQASGAHKWFNAASGTAGNAISFTQAMTLDSSGNLLVGKTTAAESSGGNGLWVGPTGFLGVNLPSTLADTFNVYNSTAGAYRFFVTQAGVINATSTTITGISDQRLKENIRDLDDGLEKVMALQPRKFDWKEGKGAGTKDARGFIAQEFEQVFPDLIEQWKDEPPEGEEPYKAVRADLIPTLVKAIQEQQALITQLQADVAALKGQA